MKHLFFLGIFFLHWIAASGAPTGKNFDRIIFVVFENANYEDTLRQPFFKYLADNGALFTNFFALARPSQGNYFALTSGDLHGIKDNKPYDIDSKNIVDLLDEKKLSWKVYAEHYPGDCFTGEKHAWYVRKHNPFISYLNIQKNLKRCANIVNAKEFAIDLKNKNLPAYSFYIPNLKNDGHDTGVAYADKWYQRTFKSLTDNAKLMNRTLLVSTFDESKDDKTLKIYTSLYGPMIKPGKYGERFNLVSLLKMVEENWDLGSLGANDQGAPSIKNIWK